MLPIKRVVLFKHGVGYFQRQGTVAGDRLLELSFKAGEMNDVLKSLTALDYGGGTFAALSYDSEEPLERRLAELNMNIPHKGAVAAFLDGLKGARVALPRGGRTLEGSVVGIEEVRRERDGALLTEPHLAVLAEGGRLVRVPLLEVDELRFLDESVQGDLATLLDILFSGLRKDRKRLSIQALGQGERQLSISYVVEAPVWKTSYRIVLPAGAEQKPLLQGWALVDNTTEDDWNGVQLSLVAGLPISFIHDLYTPRYRRRPVVEVEEEEAVAPPVVEAGELMDMEDEAFGEAPMAQKTAAPPRAAKRMRAAAPAGPPPEMAESARASVEVHTRTQEVGDLFAYEINQPVDIARSRSALVPILQAEAALERVVLYNPDIRDKNPMTAFRFKNDTGLTLEGGPVTVFEGDGYAGEAMLDTMRRDEERITPYSVELGVTVGHEQTHERQAVTRVTKTGNYIHQHYRRLLHTDYRFQSRLQRELTAYLDHRFSHDGREDTPEPVEITDSFWRFKLALPPGRTTAFRVTEVADDYEAISIPGIARKTIHRLARQALISDETVEQLERIAAQAETIQKLEQDIQRAEREESKIEQGQQRLRDNLQALRTSTEEAQLRQKYVAKLAAEEERIEALQAEVESLRRRLESESERLQQMIDALKLD
jgi:hypothetical protein